MKIRIRKRERCYYLSIIKNEKAIDWAVFYWDFAFDVSYESCGYFDNRPNINIAFIFFRLSIMLPFRNKWTDECDPPKWGIAIHNNSIWIYMGGLGNFNGGNKTKSWELPFLTKKWVRTSILLSDGSWEHESVGNNKNFWQDEWKAKQKSWNYDFVDKFDNSVIPTTIYVDEREWRPKWFTWTNLFSIVSRTIDVHFSKEVGRRKGSWKGGTIGCGYTMKPGESPLDCLKRMEVEREF